MKRILFILIAFCCLFAMSATASESPDFASLTGIGAVQNRLDGGATIVGADYVEDFGSSASSFSTSDSEEIELLWDALSRIRLEGEIDQKMPDWNPSITFRLSDGSGFSVNFNAQWLDTGDARYELSDDEEFWRVTSQLVRSHASDAPAAQKPAGYAYFNQVALTVNGNVVSTQELEDAMRLYQFRAALRCAPYGYGYDITDPMNAVDALDKLVFDIECQFVLQQRAIALQIELTDEERQQALATASEKWQNCRDIVIGETTYAFMPAGYFTVIPGDAEGNITRYLESFGLTQEVLYAEACNDMLEQKLIEAVTEHLDGASEDDKTDFYSTWFAEWYNNADIHENGVAITEVCLHVLGLL
jgi:hypothetical protein